MDTINALYYLGKCEIRSLSEMSETKSNLRLFQSLIRQKSYLYHIKFTISHGVNSRIKFGTYEIRGFELGLISKNMIGESERRISYIPHKSDDAVPRFIVIEERLLTALH